MVGPLAHRAYLCHLFISNSVSPTSQGKVVDATWNHRHFSMRWHKIIGTELIAKEILRKELQGSLW
jgi:hypothetical protein